MRQNGKGQNLATVGLSVTYGSNKVKSLVGQYDEIRLRGGSLSAARIKADYDMIANRKFCTYGTVKKGRNEENPTATGAR